MIKEAIVLLHNESIESLAVTILERRFIVKTPKSID